MEINSIWYEKYAPKTLDDVILPDNVKSQLKKWISDGKLPNLGFWSQLPGLGKTSTCKAIINTMGADAIFINASLEKGIDVLRSKILQFASSNSLSDDPKIVIMDECLEENEKVILIINGEEVPTKLNEIEKGKIYQCKSFNMETGEFENDTCEIISDKEDDLYEVELEDGRTVKVNGKHPFIVRTKDGKFIQKSINDGLNEDDDIVCYNSKNNKIKRISKIGFGRVINLTVHKNHTFITENGIVTHNCDNITRDAQAAFRGFLDEFSGNCSFIFTGNYKSKMIEPLLDRLQNYDFASFSQQEMVKPIFEKLKFITESEGVTFDDTVKSNIVKIIQNCYPRIRNMIGCLQRSLTNGTFEVESEGTNFDEIIQTMRSKDYQTLLSQVNSLPNPDAMFEYLYKNVTMFSNLPQAVLVLAKGQFQAEQVRDKNLNLAAVLVELMGCL